MVSTTRDIGRSIMLHPKITVRINNEPSYQLKPSPDPGGVGENDAIINPPSRVVAGYGILVSCFMSSRTMVPHPLISILMTTMQNIFFIFYPNN